ncbi:MAG: SulP family inorganic anion transporter [Panacagrimonas sp.]
MFQHLRGYRAADVYQDALAGTVTAILLVPQTLAYSLLAGLPPQMGLYAGILPPIIYALTGTSRMSVVGPVAVQAVMIAAALSLASVGPHGAVIIAATAGVLLLAMGVMRMGWLTHFISRPVLSGFTTGAAIFIISTQFGALMGITIPREGTPIESMLALVRGLPEINVASSLFGWLSVLLLVLARRPLAMLFDALGLHREAAVFIGRAAPLFAVAIATAVSVAIAASTHYGVKVVGEIPRGLPSVSLDFITLKGWMELLPSAVLIAIVGYVETITVAKVLGFRRRQKVDPDRELIALGLANLGAASVGAMPAASGFTKSSANFEAGAQSQLSALVAASWVALSAALLTGLLHELPRPVLSAIIIVAVWKLIDLPSLRHNWRFSRGDGMSQVVTIAGVQLLGVEQGLLAGGALAAALFMYRTSRPHIAVLGRVPGTQHYRSSQRRNVETYDHLLLVRVDESLYFANTPRVESELQRLVVDHPKATDVVLVMSGVGHIDASSLEMLEQFERELHASNMRLRIAEAKGPLMEQLQGSLLLERIGPSRVHLSTHDAVASMAADLY